MEAETKFYNAGEALGVIGITTTHRSGEYSYLPSYENPWIRTECLFDTYEEASRAPVAVFNGVEVQ